MRIACTAEDVRIIVAGEKYSHWHLDENYKFHDEDYEPYTVHEMASICRRSKAYIKGIVDGSRVMAGKFTRGLAYVDGAVVMGSIRVVENGRMQVVTDMDGVRMRAREAARLAGIPSDYLEGIIAGTRNMRGIVKRGLVG